MTASAVVVFAADEFVAGVFAPGDCAADLGVVPESRKKKDFIDSCHH